VRVLVSAGLIAVAIMELAVFWLDGLIAVTAVFMLAVTVTTLTFQALLTYPWVDSSVVCGSSAG